MSDDYKLTVWVAGMVVVLLLAIVGGITANEILSTIHMKRDCPRVVAE